MTFLDFVNEISDWLGWAQIIILLPLGLYFTIRSGFIQIRHFPHTFGVMMRSFKSEHGGVSSFGAYCTSLAGRVGTGNIAGVAIAIHLGGPGAIFWMWVVALVGMATSFIESTLAQLYKFKESDGTYRGGPAYYMEKGLGSRGVGIAFSIMLLITYGIIFNAVQSNSLAAGLQVAFDTNNTAVGIITFMVAGVVIFGGIRRISHFAEVVVPFMAVMYLLVAFYVLFANITDVPAVLAMIVKSAFGLDQAVAGGIGAAILHGVQRGLFSNEAGLGSSPNAAATADVKHPASQGYVQMLGVFTDTIVICTCTAVIILLSGVYQPGGELSGVALTQEALSHDVGGWAKYFLAIAVVFFTFTTIIANYYYGENALMFITNDNLNALPPFRVLVLAVVMAGAVGDNALVWSLSNVSMAFMAFINLGSIAVLGGIALKLMRDYNDQLKTVKEPVFDRNRLPELADKLDKDVWQ